jgi:AcrR family transcriptional regulator
MLTSRKSTEEQDLPQGHRDRLLPVVAATFADLGYRRTTTADLAQQCGVRENVLYRIWPTKKAMFIDAIGYVLNNSLTIWRKLLGEGGGEGGDKREASMKLLEYEAAHHGEFGLYRIVFSGLGETDDAEIRAALQRMYREIHAFIVRILAERDGAAGSREEREAVAWALVGLGTVSNITRELKLLGDNKRRGMIADIGRTLLKEP